MRIKDGGDFASESRMSFIKKSALFLAVSIFVFFLSVAKANETETQLEQDHNKILQVNVNQGHLSISQLSIPPMLLGGKFARLGPYKYRVNDDGSLTRFNEGDPNPKPLWLDNRGSLLQVKPSATELVLVDEILTVSSETSDLVLKSLDRQIYLLRSPNTQFVRISPRH